MKHESTENKWGKPPGEGHRHRGLEGDDAQWPKGGKSEGTLLYT